MEFYLYILECNDKSYYTGHTEDLERRLAEHKAGVCQCYTFNRRPVRLVYTEAFASRVDALIAERKIKKWTRRKKEKLIRFGWKGFVNVKSVPK